MKIHFIVAILLLLPLAYASPNEAPTISNGKAYFSWTSGNYFKLNDSDNDMLLARTNNNNIRLDFTTFDYGTYYWSTSQDGTNWQTRTFTYEEPKQKFGFVAGPTFYLGWYPYEEAVRLMENSWNEQAGYLDELGANTIRIYIYLDWFRNPKKHSPIHEYTTEQVYDYFDRLFDIVNEQGFELVVALSDFSYPEWTIEGYTEILNDFTQRYGNKIDHYQIWNQPQLNSPGRGSEFISNMRSNPSLYAQIFKQASDTIKSVDPSIPVMSNTLWFADDSYLLGFLDELYLLDPTFDSIDYISWRPYQGLSEDWPPDTIKERGHPFMATETSTLQDYLNDKGITKDMGFYVTEYGYDSGEEYYSVGEEKQAQYFAKLIFTLMKSRPRFDGFNWYSLYDLGGEGGNMGVLDSNFRKRQAFNVASTLIPLYNTAEDIMEYPLDTDREDVLSVSFTSMGKRYIAVWIAGDTDETYTFDFLELPQGANSVSQVDLFTGSEKIIPIQNSNGQQVIRLQISSLPTLLKLDGNRKVSMDRQAFIVNDKDWRTILKLIPLTTWKSSGEDCNMIDDDTCAYPLLIYNEEQLKSDIDGDFDMSFSLVNFLKLFDVDKVIHVENFPKYYDNTEKTYVRPLLRLLEAPKNSNGRGGAGLKPEQIYEGLDPVEFFSYWEVYNDVVICDDNYPQLMDCALFASDINAPLIFSSEIQKYTLALEGKNLYLMGVDTTELIDVDYDSLNVINNPQLQDNLLYVNPINLGYSLP